MHPPARRRAERGLEIYLTGIVDARRDVAFCLSYLKSRPNHRPVILPVTRRPILRPHPTSSHGRSRRPSGARVCRACVSGATSATATCTGSAHERRSCGCSIAGFTLPARAGPSDGGLSGGVGSRRPGSLGYDAAMVAAICARPACGNEPTHHVWGWVHFEGVRGWALLQWCAMHFADVEPGLRRAERTGHAVIDGPMPTRAPED